MWVDLRVYALCVSKGNDLFEFLFALPGGGNTAKKEFTLKGNICYSSFRVETFSEKRHK